MPGPRPYGSEGNCDGSEKACPYCKYPQSTAHMGLHSYSLGGASDHHQVAQPVDQESTPPKPMKMEQLASDQPVVP